MSHYHMAYNQYKACQKMSKNEFSRWITTVADEMWQEGYRKACEDVPEGSIVLNPEDNIVVNWDYDEFYNMLTSIKGIGPKLAEQIIDKMYEKDDNIVEGSQ